MASNFSMNQIGVVLFPSMCHKNQILALKLWVLFCSFSSLCGLAHECCLKRDVCYNSVVASIQFVEKHYPMAYFAYGILSH